MSDAMTAYHGRIALKPLVILGQMYENPGTRPGPIDLPLKCQGYVRERPLPERIGSPTVREIAIRLMI
jgi:hypothetical protein